MKKTALIFCLLVSLIGFSQKYNGIYKNADTGMVLKISKHNVTNGTLVFEISGSDHPCQDSRTEKAECCVYDEKSNEFTYQSGQDGTPEFLYLTFNSNGTLSVKPDNENSFYYSRNCAVFSETLFNKVLPKKVVPKKPIVKKK